MPIWVYIECMARAATTTDVFNAIAEPRRRRIVEVLSLGKALTVSALVATLGLPQPTVSKHLGVLRKVGVVSVSKQGQQRWYELNASELKTVHDWAKTFEQLWTGQLGRIKARAEEMTRKQTAGPGEPRKEK
jgi:DNA-binding transcriptional ArsR family regulator